jgi:uncharacterized membrane protein
MLLVSLIGYVLILCLSQTLVSANERRIMSQVSVSFIVAIMVTMVWFGRL